MKKKTGLILLIVVSAIIFASGATYAWMTWQGRDVSIGGTSECFTIDYTNGSNIIGPLKLVSVPTKPTNGSKFTATEEMGTTSVRIGINTGCEINGTFKIKLNTTLINAELKNASLGNYPVHYVVTDSSNNILSTGVVNNSGTINMLTSTLSLGTQMTYNVIIYIDGDYLNNPISGTAYSGNITAEAEQTA